uniref:SET domain-containing protein n=1 Tax=Rhizophora mucronata TaxID=61149 RepID=A0A2P2R2T9_RHIMU
MIHDVPQGREICLSYFPVNWDFATRQKRLAEDYGFTCGCDRCQVEATWSDADDIHNDNDDDDDNLDIGDEDENENEMMIDQECVEAMTETTLDNTDSNNFPHAYFFLRYMCNRENCCGTLAPLPPSDRNPSNLLECNVCGNIKKDEFVDG